MSSEDSQATLAQWGFIPFPVGQIHTPLLPEYVGDRKLSYGRVRSIVPGRLLCVINDPVKLVMREPTGEFNYGEVSAGVNLFTYAEAAVNDSGQLVISSRTKRPSIIRHFAEVMLKTLDYKRGLWLEANNSFPYSHVGSGSSAALAIATALAINKLLGEPIEPERLPLFLAQNYGEEMAGEEDILVPVQCTGGTAWMALSGGLIAVNDNRLTARMDIPNDLIYLIGLPDYPRLDAGEAMAREAAGAFQYLLDSAEHMRPFCARVFKLLESAIQENDIDKAWQTIGEIYSDEVFVAGFDTMFPSIYQTFQTLKELLMRPSPPFALFISSAGPSIVAICQRAQAAQALELYRQVKITNVVSAAPVNHGVVYALLEPIT